MRWLTNFYDWNSYSKNWNIPYWSRIVTADLNPLDYFVWSYVENITNMASHDTKASLIAAIHRVFVELQPALVEKACSQYLIRIEAVIEAEGGYIG